MDDNLQPQAVDAKAVREHAKAAWIAEQRQRDMAHKVSVQEWIGTTVPYWLIAIALGLAILSAPHTAEMFGLVSRNENLGWVAPVFVEFSLFYAEFRRHKNGGKAPAEISNLQRLMFITAVIVNGTGAFVSVVNHAGIQDASFSEIRASFHDLPATHQAAFLLVPLVALIVPYGTMIAGGGMAALILEAKEERFHGLDKEWAEISKEVEFFALRDAALDIGKTPDDANEWAWELTQWKGAPRPKRKPAQVVQIVQPTLSDLSDRTSDIVQRRTSFGHSRTSDGSTKVIEYHRANPKAWDMTTRAVAEIVGVSADTVSRARRAMQAQEEDTQETQAIEPPILEDARTA